MNEMFWSFDDDSIGQMHVDGTSLKSRLLYRNTGMHQQNWYKLANNICHFLNQASVVPAPLPNLTQAEVDAVLQAAFPTVRPEDMGDHVALTLDQPKSTSMKPDKDSIRIAKQFADQYRSGAQGATMDYDSAQALALSIDDILSNG